MIKIQGIDHVAFNVRDLDKALEFYTKIIGLKITEREPSKPGIEYFLDCGPSLLGIIQANDLNNSHLFANEGGNKLEATAWPLEDKIAEDKRIKEIYDSKTRSWKAY